MTTQAREQVRWWYSPDEVAERSPLSAQLVREQCRSGTIRAQRIGTKWIIPAAEVARLRCEAEATHDDVDALAEAMRENERLRGELTRLRELINAVAL